MSTLRIRRSGAPSASGGGLSRTSEWLASLVEYPRAWAQNAASETGSAAKVTLPEADGQLAPRDQLTEEDL